MVLVVGEFDKRFAEVAGEIATNVQTASVVTIADAGHATHVEAPGATAAAIIGAWEQIG